MKNKQLIKMLAKEIQTKFELMNEFGKEDFNIDMISKTGYDLMHELIKEMNKK
jgi:hypothetical protein